jgi:hypothetical protein
MDINLCGLCHEQPEKSAKTVQNSGSQFQHWMIHDRISHSGLVQPVSGAV